MASNPIQNELDAILSQSPSYDFRTACDTTQFTKAIGIATTADLATKGFNITNETTGNAISWHVDMKYHAVRTKTAITPPTGYFVVYIY